MANFFESLTDEHIEFIRSQHMFFIATSPPSGRINLSPKGMDTLRVIGPKEAAYLDLTGSGNETAAHILADGRATVMLCSFGEKPMILRLYCRGSAVLPKSETWNRLKPLFPSLPGSRQIIHLAIESAQTSCGFAVPKYTYVETRQRLVEWACKLDDDQLEDYRRKSNARSIDGLKTPFADETIS